MPETVSNILYRRASYIQYFLVMKYLLDMTADMRQILTCLGCLWCLAPLKWCYWPQLETTDLPNVVFETEPCTHSATPMKGKAIDPLLSSPGLHS